LAGVGGTLSEVIGWSSGWTPTSEQDDFMKFPVCHETLEMRDPGQALDTIVRPTMEAARPKLRRTMLAWRSWATPISARRHSTR
jgi:hypothetical protein